jgi:DNA-directed RNA polymerase subunit RPC12/RpoP
MEPGQRPSWGWGVLWDSETHVAVRLGTSIAVGVLLLGFVLLATWTWARLAGVRYLPDEVVGLALVPAGALWCVSLWLLWRRASRLRVFFWSLIATIVIGALTGLGCILAEEVLRYEDEYFMTGVALCGSALVLLVWLVALQRYFGGRPVIGTDNQVDVRCPACGYSLVGLTELRCPECGTRFTIDELIRAQRYARSRHLGHTVSLPKATPQPRDVDRRTQA